MKKMAAPYCALSYKSKVVISDMDDDCVRTETLEWRTKAYVNLKVHIASGPATRDPRVRMAIKKRPAMTLPAAYWDCTVGTQELEEVPCCQMSRLLH